MYAFSSLASSFYLMTVKILNTHLAKRPPHPFPRSSLVLAILSPLCTPLFSILCFLPMNGFTLVTFFFSQESILTYFFLSLDYYVPSRNNRLPDTPSPISLGDRHQAAGVFFLQCPLSTDSERYRLFLKTLFSFPPWYHPPNAGLSERPIVHVPRIPVRVSALLD